MLKIGKTDAFELGYMAKFKAFSSQFGEFVTYERDRAARDIGLHLTKEVNGGGRQVTSTLCWFQMKGIMASTLSKQEYDQLKEVSVSLSVNHLRFWFLDSMPTHLVVYVECADKFLTLNLQEYVRTHWGRKILTLNQGVATVKISVESELDEQAFGILLARGDVKQWAKALNAEEHHVTLARRDYELIYKLGTAKGRNVEHQMHYMSWISKTRGEVHIYERPIKFVETADHCGWKDIRTHFEYGGLDPVSSYPYITLSVLDDDELSLNAPSVPQNQEVDGYEAEDDFYPFEWNGEDEYDGEFLDLSDGQRIFGPNCANEYCLFMMNVELNELGYELFEQVQFLINIGLLELINADQENGEFVSVAPWHHRDV